MPEPLLTQFMQPLLAGRRSETFGLIQGAVRNGQPAEHLLCEVIWPAMSQIERLYNDDRINMAVANMATRICRTAADQLQLGLARNPALGKRVLIACADHMQEELGAQIIADLFQSQGWDVYFIGGGVPHDEIMQLVGQVSPHLLVIFGTHPQAVPSVRALIERIREIGVCPSMNILVSGGVFNRADGLWEEVGADVFATDARAVIETARDLGPRKAAPPKLGIVKKRRRRRKPTPLATAAVV